MKIIISLNHPAHYYVFKYTVRMLRNDGNQVLYVIKNKDVLENILKCEKEDYIKLQDTRKRKHSKFSILVNGFVDLFEHEKHFYKVVKKYQPNLMVGTCIAMTHIGKLMHIPTLMFNEDDFEINKMACRASYPFATKIVAPDICSVGKYDYKKISYSGYQKMAYLNPKYFQPLYSYVKDIIPEGHMFFIIRLVSLTAGHDIEGKHNGIDDELLDKIIDKLSVKGQVFINSEKTISTKYSKYILNVSSNLIHHYLAYASLFIGDSQTMCAEAGLLGTPFIRFNDFVGKISYLNEIENKYHLGYGLRTNQNNELLPLIDNILSIPDLKNQWLERRDKLLNDKSDVAETFYRIINNFLNN